MTVRAPVVVRAITWLPVGGIERRLVTVVPLLRERGWDVRVLCLREAGPLAEELRAKGVTVEVVPLHSRLAPSDLARLTTVLRRHRAEIVHAHMYRSNIPATIAGLMAGVPVRLAQIHNVDSWDSARQALVDRVVSRVRTATLAVSRAVQRDVMARLALPEASVPILYNGIDTVRFSPGGPTGLRKQWRVEETDLLFVVPARLHPQKNPFGVVEAFESLGWDVAARLVFVGTGKLEGELRERIQQSPLAGRIHLAGQVDDMPAVYRAADAVVLSSFKEGFSNAVVEALAVGKPVIASDVGGNAEAIDSPRVGWIHPAGDGKALAEQLRVVVELGRAGLERMQADCVARAQCFSIGALVDQTHQLYGRLLGRFPQ